MTEPTSNLGMEDGAQENESWKREVASRLDSYRSKSKRKLSGDFSMRFNFDGEPAQPRQPICVSRPSEKDALNETASQSDPAVEEAVGQEDTETQVLGVQVDLPRTVPPTALPPLRPSVPFKRKIVMEANVIEFPRLFPPEPPPSNMLAEPIGTSAPPRILDAPEIAEPLLETPILEGMRLEHLEHEIAPDLELPLQVAPVVQRVYASAWDGLMVAFATAIFGAATYRLLPGLEWTKPILGAMALVPVILWAAYQYLFIVYGARTPGMAMAQVGFSTFQGTAPNHRERRRRVIGMALSCSSLMLGFLWAFFDEDTLGWHDRISRTYVFRQRS